MLLYWAVFGRIQHTLPQLKFKFQQRYLQQQTPPKTCQEHEILLVELEGRDREHRLLIDQLHVDIKLKESIIDTIKEENSRLKDKIEELEEEIKMLDEELKKAENLEEMEEMIAVVKQKNERVEELEEALRQSVTITSDMETERNEEDGHMREITQKLEALEQKLHRAKEQHPREGGGTTCSYCPQLRLKLQQTSDDLKTMIAERRRHLEELFDMKQDALMSALSEKDAHLALLEESSLKGQSAQDEYKRLTQERAAVLRAMHRQGEGRVLLLQEYDEQQQNTESTLPKIEISSADVTVSSDEERDDDNEIGHEADTSTRPTASTTVVSSAPPVSVVVTDITKTSIAALISATVAATSAPPATVAVTDTVKTSIAAMISASVAATATAAIVPEATASSQSGSEGKCVSSTCKDSPKGPVPLTEL